jgi:putative membrane-bound dehydrogenase-like protein
MNPGKVSSLCHPFLLLLFLLISCSTVEHKTDEHAPQRSLADLKVYEGLRVSLFASEPMMTNPTNIDIDSRGRVWVCEAFNYRNNLNPDNPLRKEGDRILILEDTDGDGRADSQKVFYQGPEINAALGICVLGKRVMVSCSPNVFVFTDEDGDDVPEKKEILFEGIHGIQHDHGIHSFYFGHDGRLYFSMGNEGKVLLRANGDTVTDINGYKIIANGHPFRQGMVMRTDLEGEKVEVVGHNFRNNYESTLDPFGTLWQSDNDDDGNKGTRINYVMEYGNYGFTDEMTGAGWRSRRTNMELEIPLQHWHLNDPGVVPNLLQTGSGSPAGMTMYEGDLLPDVFRGQIIHAEPGHNVVRSYPVEKDGAGYKAIIIDILAGQKDQWFRPVDVAIAPDGSLFVADWYDPGVGGHQVGDLERGRIYRIAPSAHYQVAPPHLETPDEAVSALLCPNSATRFLAWSAISSFGNKAEAALRTLWESDNKRHRAQALWLLSHLPGSGDQYLDQAIRDPDEDIRITGLRAARALQKELLPALQVLANDRSPQVRREVAIALRGNQTQAAAELWTKLAKQYDGNDRWYLEALGIGAAGNDDLFFSTWINSVGNNWNSSPNRDIIWRSRSTFAVPYLARLITAADEKQMLRYYRAFDFHAGPGKQKELVRLALSSRGEKAMYAFKHMDPSAVKITSALAMKLNEVLGEYENQIDYVEIINAFDLRTKAPSLLTLGLLRPESETAKEAIHTLVRWDRIDLLQRVFSSDDINAQRSLIKSLKPQMSDDRIISLMESVMVDTARELGLRQEALRAFGGNGESEDRLLQLAKENRIPAGLTSAAAGVFQNIWRKDIRDEAAQYIRLPAGKNGNSLPDVAILERKEGDVAHGHEVFNAICSTCHMVNGQGTDFGPQLSEIGSKLSRQALYKAILYPDLGISFGYEGYSFEMKDGSKAFGMITSETGNQVTLKYIDNIQTFNKTDIISRTPVSNSMMPSNLQSNIGEQDLVDLVEYLMTLKGGQNL